MNDCTYHFDGLAQDCSSSIANALGFMMTSSNGNIFRVTGYCAGNSPVPGEFPTQRPVTRSFDVFFHLRLNKRLSKQSWGWWFQTLSRPLWRQCNVLQSCAKPSIYIWCVRFLLKVLNICGFQSGVLLCPKEWHTILANMKPSRKYETQTLGPLFCMRCIENSLYFCWKYTLFH